MQVPVATRLLDRQRKRRVSALDINLQQVILSQSYRSNEADYPYKRIYYSRYVQTNMGLCDNTHIRAADSMHTSASGSNDTTSTTTRKFVVSGLNEES